MITPELLIVELGNGLKSKDFTSKEAATDKRSPHSSNKALSCAAVSASCDNSASMLCVCIEK